MNISKKEFEKKYNTMLLIDLAKELNISVVSIQNIRRKLKIKPKGLKKKVNILDA